MEAIELVENMITNLQIGSLALTSLWKKRILSYLQCRPRPQLEEHKELMSSWFSFWLGGTRDRKSYGVQDLRLRSSSTQPELEKYPCFTILYMYGNALGLYHRPHYIFWVQRIRRDNEPDVAHRMFHEYIQRDGNVRNSDESIMTSATGLHVLCTIVVHTMPDRPGLTEMSQN